MDHLIVWWSSRQLTSHPRDEWAADWSPDGQSIVFNAGDREDRADLWSIPSAGGVARQLTDHRNYAASWSPDGKWIAYCNGASRRIGSAQFNPLITDE